MLTFHVKVEKVTEATGLCNITDSSLLDIHNPIACWLQVIYVLRQAATKCPQVLSRAPIILALCRIGIWIISIN